MINAKYHSEPALCKMIFAKYHSELALCKVVLAKYQGELGPCKVNIFNSKGDIAPSKVTLTKYHHPPALHKATPFPSTTRAPEGKHPPILCLAQLLHPRCPNTLTQFTEASCVLLEDSPRGQVAPITSICYSYWRKPPTHPTVEPTSPTSLY